VSALLGLGGWLATATAVASVLVLRARLVRVAEAEHELRGPATVLCMACERLRADPVAQGHAQALETELARLRAGLADLTAARSGGRRRTRREPLELEPIARSAVAGWEPALERDGRPARIAWRAGRARIAADRGRLAQAIGNLVANAAEHGSGPLELRSRRTAEGVRLEVRNGRSAPSRSERSAPRRDRGRGLDIAARAAASAGGRLELVPGPEEVVAALDLPVQGEPLDEAGPAPDAHPAPDAA
jgi:nitrogen fixation/metabolism regulation signal transduction histidine kinase